MRVAVTGVNGFVGQHLARELVDAGHIVVGVGLGTVAPGLQTVLADYAECDLSRAWPPVEAEGIVHLAALSAVGPSFNDPQRYLEANSAPLTHLAEAMLRQGRAPRIVVVSTGAVYGANDGIPLVESAPMVPTSPYVVSKMLTEAQCAYYRRRGLDVLAMRPFNHIGPGQGAGFILPDLVAGVVRWRDHGKPVTVGNLTTRRDYTDVRDVVRAYRLTLESLAAPLPVLNVCSGVSVSGQTLLNEVARAVGVHDPAVVVDSALLRPSDPHEVRGDHTLIQRTVGWVPRIPLEQTVADVVAGWAL